MALQLNPLTFMGSFLPVRKSKQNLLPVGKSKQNLLPIEKQRNRQPRLMKCISMNTSETDDRFSIYQATIWSRDFIKTLNTHFPMSYMKRIEELEQKLVMELDVNNGNDSLQLLEIIDNVEKLGLSHRFQNIIRTTLEKISSLDENNFGVEEKNDNLYAISLRFRLLRQHNYIVSQDFLKRFKDIHGDFIGYLRTDVKGLLSLYEASFLAFEDERDLHEAKLFATQHLLKLKGEENEIMEHINYALELPVYRRMLRLQARWYIDTYRKQKNANQLALELAILDFNMVQSAHKRDLQQVLKWWDDMGLSRKLKFNRDRPVECFYWGVGIVFEPQYDSCRIGISKVSALITTFDDIYDIVHGSLDELKHFTDAIKRWDIAAMKHMPDCLQLSFLALYNMVHELGYKTFVAQGVNIIPLLAQVWGELCEAFFVESKWIHSNHTPTFKDYIENAWLSSSGVVVLTHAYFLIYQADNNKQLSLDSYEKYRDLFKWPSMIFRLCNDLASTNEMKRGETTNALTCYMQENNVCEEVARQYIETLVDEAWSKWIKARVGCSQEMEDAIIDMSLNLARMSHSIYQYGDGIGDPDETTKERVLSVLIEPITINEKDHQCP